MVMCGVCMLLGAVCLPPGMTGSRVWVSARVMESVASSVVVSNMVDGLFLFLVLFV